MRIVPSNSESQAFTSNHSEDEADDQRLLYSKKSITLEDFERLKPCKQMSYGSASNYSYLPVWRRAIFRIKVRRVLSDVSEEIVKYGTSSDFCDITGKFRQNLDQILWKKQNKQENFRLCSDSIDDSLPWNLIHPESGFIKIWSLIMSLILLYTASIMPIRVAFYDVVFFDAWTIFDLMMDSLFGFDIIVNCIVTYERRDGTLERNSRKVLSRYARSWLIFDFIACLPFSFIEYGSSKEEYSSSRADQYNNLIRLLRVPRLYKLLRILRIAKAFKNYRDKTFISQLQDYLRMNSRKT